MTKPDTSGPADTEVSIAERELLDAAPSGTLVDFRAAGNTPDQQGGETEASATIRAQVLIDLLTGHDQPDGPRRRAVKVRGARITGTLALDGETLACPLLLADCDFDRGINLSDASASRITLIRCRVPVLYASHLRTANNLTLGVTGRHIDLTGAEICGRLSLTGAHLDNPGGIALLGDDLTVTQSMFCTGLSSRGALRLLGASIGGQLNFSAARLASENAPALYADQLTVNRSMICDELTVEGEVRMIGAQILGQLSMNGAVLTNTGKPALTVDSLRVDGSMSCTGGFTARGSINLLGAHIGGQLNLAGARIINDRKWALLADKMIVEQNMFCRGGFTARGEIRLIGARIGGSVEFTGANLANPGGRALNAEGLTVGAGVIFGDGFNAVGETSLAAASITGPLVFRQVSLSNKNGVALRADHLNVGMSMLCGQGFSASGEVTLQHAVIGGRLNLNGASLINEGGRALNGVELTVAGGVLFGGGFVSFGEVNLAAARTGSRLIFRGSRMVNPGRIALRLTLLQTAALDLRMRQEPVGSVDLTQARVGVFIDNPASWPTSLYLGGFAYDTFENVNVSVRERIGWATRHRGGYAPQIYNQVAAAYQRAGNDAGARKIAIAKQMRRRHRYNPLNWLWYLTVGYGYRTWWAALWLAALITLGTIVFSSAYPAHMTATRTHPPAFQPLGYTIDVLLPVVSLGEKSAWQPSGTALYLSWALTLAGWTLTSAVVAGLSGVLKRD